jgi:hypothetical protein
VPAQFLARRVAFLLENACELPVRARHVALEIVRGIEQLLAHDIGFAHRCELVRQRAQIAQVTLDGWPATQPGDHAGERTKPARRDPRAMHAGRRWVAHNARRFVAQVTMQTLEQSHDCGRSGHVRVGVGRQFLVRRPAAPWCCSRRCRSSARGSKSSSLRIFS